MKSKVYSIIILITLSLSASANFRLSGTVVDANSGQPIVGAEIYNRTTDQLVTTNKEGFFEMNNLPAGDYDIVVFSLEYQTLEKTIQLKQDLMISIPMSEFQSELTEVVISQKREEIFALKRLQHVEGTSIFAGKKSEVVLMDLFVGNAAANNARQIYSQVVGLNIYENMDAGLQLNIGGRGLDPNRTANFNTRQNGYDISADVLGYPESYYTPPAEALSEIQVVRGAASLQYGTQFGGLLNFKMKGPSSKKIELATRQSVGSFGLFNSFNSVGGTIGKFSYYTYYNRKSGDGFRANSEFKSDNFYGFFGYEFNEQTKVSFEATYLNYLSQQAGGLTDSIFNANPNFTNRTRNWFEVNWKLAALKLEHRFSPQSKLSVNIFGLDAERNALGFRGDPTQLNLNPVTQEDIQNPDRSWEYERDLIKGTFRNWGLETRYLTRYQLMGKNAVFLIGAKYYHANNTSLQGPGSTGTSADFTFQTDQFPDYPNQSIFDFPNRNLALFGEHIFFLSDRFSITPGFRLEYIKTESRGIYQQVNFNNAGNPIFNEQLNDNRDLSRSFVLLGLGASYEPSENMEVYANVSQNYRSVTFSDIRVVNPSFVIDPDISDESGYTFDGGLRGKWNELLSYDLGGFGLLYDDRIGIIFDDRANRVRKNIGKAIIYGLEFFSELNLLRVLRSNSNQAKLSFFSNIAITESQYLDSEENNVIGNKVEFIPRWNLKTGLRFGYKNFLGSLQYTYLSEQYTDVENSNVAEQGDARAGLIGPIPSYQIMDLSLSYTYKHWKLETGANNLLDEKYFTRRATGYPGPGIIPSEPRSYYVTVQFKI